MEERIISTVIGTYIVEDYGDKDYDVATNIMDGQHFYHIPKGLSEQEVKNFFVELAELEE